MSTFQETAKDLFDKGYSAASDMAAKAKIKMQIYDQSVEYGKLMKQLGIAVYEEVKLDPRYTNAFPELFKKIEEVIERKKALETELAHVDSSEDLDTPVIVPAVQEEENEDQTGEGTK